MQAGELEPSFNHSNAKSCIQALLKSREQKSNAAKHNPFTSDLVPTFNGSFVGVPDYSGTEICSERNPIYVPNLCEYNPDEFVSSDHLDNQNDFNYSQKLFHISDGNLYSIFSPIQGRSYGMKPSFLRKQKYTVQECHSRGRKSMRKGLKFHNFLPSESVTSEKDNGFLKTKWKVRSECRLKEEHGTKQITISNWSQSASKQPISIRKAADTSMCSSRVPVLKQNLPSTSGNDHSTTSNGIIYDHDPYDFTSSLQYNGSGNVFSRVSTESSTSSSCKPQATTNRRNSLSFLLNSLLDKSERKSFCEQVNNFSKPYQSPKHRRKPMQTRRVVPYVKYLSIIEENESVPLDLSSKCSSEPSQSKCDESFSDSSDLCDTLVKPASNSISNESKVHPNSNFLVPTSVGNNTFNLNMLQSPMPAPLLVMSPPINNGLTVTSSFIEPHVKLNLPLNIKPIKIKKSAFSSTDTNQSYTIVNDAQFAAHKSLASEPYPRTRRRNQRSVIKQKLEDTFRQNGFLVKTKQVSDGEATFCKFRQLRKYTRYYLKSWQQHLPDEVNKMWKGFLPPKTVLPSVLESPETPSHLLP